MGERLVARVMKDQTQIAAIYYHWSAYTSSALEETGKIVHCLLDKDNPIKDTRLKLIRFLESNGGGIAGRDLSSVSAMYPSEVFTDNVHRNNGIIALTEEEQEYLVCWADGIVDIDVGEQMVYNHAFNFFTNKAAVKHRYELTDEEIEKFYPVHDYNISEIPFNKIDEITKIVTDLDYKANVYGYRTPKGDIYDFVK